MSYRSDTSPTTARGEDGGAGAEVVGGGVTVVVVVLGLVVGVEAVSSLGCEHAAAKTTATRMATAHHLDPGRFTLLGRWLGERLSSPALALMATPRPGSCHRRYLASLWAMEPGVATRVLASSSNSLWPQQQVDLSIPSASGT